MQNPMQMMGQIKNFAKGLQGNPEEMARKAIQGMDQRTLNQLQRETNELYNIAREFGIIK